MRAVNRGRAALLSLALLVGFLILWQHGSAGAVAGHADGLPGPAAVGRAAKVLLAHPFYDNGLNDRGIGFQIRDSLVRLLVGYALASVVAIGLGVALGLSPTLYQAANPYVQFLRPVSPLAWMPLFLYTVKDSGWAMILVIFMSSLWPTLANTAFGVANIKRDYLSVAALIQLSGPARLFRIILPAAAPSIVAGLRISLGSGWIAIVAAEMLVGNSGIGYFLWNEWNDLALTSVIFCILVIGALGLGMDSLLGALAKRVTYAD